MTSRPRLLISIALAAGLLATAAAAEEPVLAKLKAPVHGALRPVAGGAVFDCLGDVCAARIPSSDTAGVRGCKDLVRAVGAVTSFGPASKPLGPEQLNTCNASAR